MRKRPRVQKKSEKPNKKLHSNVVKEPEDIRELEYEDHGEDEYDSESEAVYHSGSSVGEAEEWEDFKNLRLEETKDGEISLVNDPSYNAMEEEKIEPEEEKEIWTGDPRQIKQGEILDFENEAYELFYRTSVEWSCLSLDNIKGPEMCTGFPYTIYLVSGTQAPEGQNKVYVMKWSELYKTQYDDKSASEEDSSEEEAEEGDEAKMDYVEFSHHGVVNRIRANQDFNAVATWSEKGVVNIFDLSSPLKKLESANGVVKSRAVVVNTFNVHNEGYGLCWGYNGTLYAGGEGIHMFEYNGSQWSHSKTYNGHKDAVEDIQRSPTEQTVFASCSCDKSIKIWDTRVATADAQITMPNAHESDVNVISWNTQEASQIASGSDDCSFKVWDLRFSQQQAASIKWHSDSITSICWNPMDSCELVVASADDRITVWDLSVEAEGEIEPGYPPQLLFIHQGQEDVKEVMYHPDYQMILSTAANSFNVFRPNINVKEEEDS
ncbi:unnamed protein product [Blepharisma stoltei]|uniref:Glutamate-rich WD repeat-containing protein 1 n=1 Tax=Blepharisma stoltei TaxID=1481888 RepID=A0AAU9JLB1_9CILI|nr:unnamed protein product [Blepharisma stoltei]